jgi:Fic family protein
MHFEQTGLAFVPNPLPPQFSDQERRVFLGTLIDEIGMATEALARLDGAARGLKNPHLLLYPLMLRDAQLSSKIENTIATAEEVVLAEAGRENLRDEAREVANYVAALNHGVNSELPLCNRLIRDMHKKLMSGVRGEDKRPGEFRTIQVMIGKKGQTIADARFVPPPPGEHLRACLDSFERFLNSTSHGLPQIVAIALAHYQFECIHPFEDGNGRIGRALAALSLCKEPRPVLQKPFVYVSAYFERHQDEYYERLLRVSTNGEWMEWVRFFLSALTEEAGDTLGRIKKVLDLHAELMAIVRVPKASAVVPQLIDDLFGRPWTNAARAAQRLGIKPQAAQRHIDRLAEAGIIEEVTGGNYNRLWVFKRLLQIIEEENVH